MHTARDGTKACFPSATADHTPLLLPQDAGQATAPAGAALLEPTVLDTIPNGPPLHLRPLLPSLTSVCLSIDSMAALHMLARWTCVSGSGIVLVCWMPTRMCGHARSQCRAGAWAGCEAS
jgi:hypothetical protein